MQSVFSSVGFPGYEDKDQNNSKEGVTPTPQERKQSLLICVDEKTAANAPVTVSDGSGGPPRRRTFPGVLSTALRLLIKADTE